jgi:GAF domain-containing protein
MVELYELRASLLNILDAAITVCGASKGNIQLLDRQRGTLSIAAQRGFDGSFLQLFQLVRVDEPSACGRAFRQRQRVVIQDIARDPLFASYISIARANGFQAVQSTPIFAHDGSVLGVFSTHFARPGQYSERLGGMLDRCAGRMAALIEGQPESEFPSGTDIPVSGPRPMTARYH